MENSEMDKKSIKCIEDFDVYRKAVKVFNDFLEYDLVVLQKSFIGRTLAANQLRCLDSICANMEEGYERKSGNDIKNFFRMSKGSAGEARGRYKRLSKVLPQNVIDNRVKELHEIRAMLSSLILKWK
ncbi:MAG: four helix bundle protein [Candidatus Omnitrophica bacterium]|nr:four helix bundle protein [Candidatus Omnitrophota bacterium]